MHCLVCSKYWYMRVQAVLVDCDYLLLLLSAFPNQGSPQWIFNLHLLLSSVSFSVTDYYYLSLILSGILKPLDMLG